ncbi:transglutaminase domain-containing protein [Pelagicoccus mobilis]|uniref:Transglutaminase domain-containing protein n=1 Tax=Pelagicoccus mobilis TaxID=415221 RepID=A0A934S2K9_9BACT|nr:transglutaminase domain-containing protein [Pelagicoccus mobilis]MBK1877908.1 transglutaminase domain-containing protein [Pelagicoccus mobilis]
MKKAVSNFLIFSIALACFIASSLIKHTTEEQQPRPPDPFRTEPAPPQVPRTAERKDELNTFFASEIERTLSDGPTSPNAPAASYALPANATAVSLQAKTKISEKDVTSHAKSSKKLKNDKGFFFLDSKKQKFAATKLGIDRNHHFLNSFLVGYSPFTVSEIWMPHQVLNMRLKYQLDKDQFAGFEEIWLSSYQAFKAGRGDCEDHSIALADWLIEMGEDARVVTGTHDGGGHAWVVVIRDSGTFLLEATSKRRRRLWSSYPLAALAKGYVPKSMFNRDYYWTTEDLSKPGDYTGKHWQKAGRVLR